MSKEEWHWTIKSLVDLALFGEAEEDYYFRWFHGQKRSIEIQMAYSQLAMYLSREVTTMYRDLKYHEESELIVDYGFLPNWDLRLTGKLPEHNPLVVAQERGDFIPERQRRFWS